MLKYILQRILLAIPVIIGVSILVFFIIHLIPGDPIQIMFGKNPDPVQIEKIQHLYGLDRPLWQQYFVWIGNFLKGDWGTSIRLDQPVRKMVLSRLPRTATLSILGIITSLIIAIPAGIISAVKHNSKTDLGITSFTLLLISVPSFWLGILLIIIFSVYLNILPATGYVSPSEDFCRSIRSMIMPTLSLAAAVSATLTRVLRSSMLEVLGQDYVMLARVKGNSERRVLFIHTLRNSLIPLMTIVGMEVGYLLGGEIIIERVFAFPGMGSLLISAIYQRDYPLIQATILVFAILVVMVNIITDLFYSLADPRIKITKRVK